ncbi:MAG: DUF167 domain-containing protein [bacterium]
MRINIKVKPLSAITKIEQLDENNFVVWVKEPPTKGLANKGVCAALAKYFNVSGSQVSIVSGFTSRNKVVLID